jgi:hypothetical protein
VKRCGPSYRRARNASAALKIFVRHPKKTFSTLSGVKQTSRRKAATSVFDPEADVFRPTFAVISQAAADRAVSSFESAKVLLPLVVIGEHGHDDH